MIKVDEAGLDGDGFPGIHIEAADFSFCYRSDDILNNANYDQDRSIELDEICRSQEMVAASTAMCFRGNKVGNIRMDLEYHITSLTYNLSIGVASSIVEKVFGDLQGGLSTIDGCSCNIVKDMQHCIINSMGIK